MQTTTPQQAQYRFSIRQQGDTQIVTYQKAKYSPSIIFFGMLLFCIISFVPCMLARSGGALAFATFVLPVGLFFVANAMRKDGQFSISPKVYSVGGKEYDRAHISGLFIKEPNQQEQVTSIQKQGNGSVWIIGGSAPGRVGLGATVAVAKGASVAVDAAGLASRGAAKRILRQYARKNYKVGFTYGEQKVTLASGLEENTASALYRKIIELSEAA